MTTKSIKKMSRQEVYFALAQYVHQDHYKQIITWPTEYLESLLEWYQRPEEKKVTFKLSRKAQSILLARVGVFTWPFGYIIKND